MVFSDWKFFPRLVAFVTLGVVLIAAAGCSSHPSVSGKVTVGDKPLTTGGVVFVPDKEKGNTSKEEPQGTITEAGTYELYTDGKAGAPVGWYKVTVVALEKPDNTKPGAIKSLIDTKYNKAETTDLIKEVKSGAPTGAYDLKLDPGTGSGPSGTPGVPPMPK